MTPTWEATGIKWFFWRPSWWPNKQSLFTETEAAMIQERLEDAYTDGYLDAALEADHDPAP